MAEEQFLVHTEALRGYAGLLERNHGFVGEMRTYLDGPGSETTGLMGLMVQFQNIVENLAAGQRATQAEMLEKLGATVQGLKDAAAEYERIDGNSAAELDKIVPKAPPPPPSGGMEAV